MVRQSGTNLTPLHKFYAPKHTETRMQTTFSKNCPNINHPKLHFVAVIVAAGRGERAGPGIAKQYRSFLGEPVFLHALRIFLGHEQHKEIVIVHPPGDESYISELLNTAKLSVTDQPIRLVEGGEDRTSSVQNGLQAAKASDADAVLVHDAARPGLTRHIISGLIEALSEYHGAAPALPVVDALKFWNGANPESRSRDHLYRIQTPQAFRAKPLYELFETATTPAADEFELAETAGLSLTLTKGSEKLAKLTYPEDFERMEALLSDTETRMGLGYDVHAFEEGDAVTLCGVKIEHAFRLKGHSDADVGWHALTDAILGALSEGDIGDHFPPSDPQWKGAPSSIFLEHAGQLVRIRGGSIINLDITLICEAPKIKPHRQAMRETTAKLLGINVDRVSIKATTTEGLGFEGRREGIAAQAIASVRLPSRHSPESA